MLGAEGVVRALARQGVTTVFSLSGNQIMPLYDACIDARIRIVHVRHEAAAVFMADAWAQVTGQVGVALLTAGPGLANGVGPLYSALQAESPVLLLSGDAALAEDGMGAFQEMDQAAVTAPLTKRSLRVAAAADLPAAVDEAIACARAGRPGPVHLALPFDLLTADTGLTALPPPPAAEDAAPAPADVAALAELLRGARRPLLLVGPAQCRDRAGWQARARALQLPLACMESPRGLRDPSLGALAGCLAEADLVVLAGKALDFTLGFGRPGALGPARVAAIAPDQTALDRAERLLGERLALRCAAQAEMVCDLLAAPAQADAARSAWTARVEAAIALRTLPSAPPVPERIAPQALCEAVQRLLDTVPDPILVCDGGEFGQWAQAFCRAPLRIVNGMSGAIGGGICYAIAAKIARPGATVVLLMGDGTAGFHLAEFDTAVRERAAFVAVVGNDLRWNAEHLIQMRSYGPERLIGCALAPSARYAAVAQALGGHGAEVRSAVQLEQALRAAVASGLPACLDVALDGQPAPVFSPAAAAVH